MESAFYMLVSVRRMLLSYVHAYSIMSSLLAISSFWQRFPDLRNEHIGLSHLKSVLLR